MKSIVLKIISILGALALTACLATGVVWLMLNWEDLMIPMTEEKVTAYAEEQMTLFLADPDTVLKEQSQKKVKQEKLTSEQKKMMLGFLSDNTFTIKSVEIGEGRKEAVVEIVFDKVKLLKFSGDNYAVGTSRELQKMIDGMKSKRRTYELKLVKDGKDWIFEDLSDLYDDMIRPYTVLSFLDDDGEAINRNDEYFRWYSDVIVLGDYVDAYWYDPLSGNPMTSGDITDPQALQAVFYFDRPMDLDLVAMLRRDGKDIAALNVIRFVVMIR